MNNVTARKSRHFFYSLDILFPMLLLIGITILFRNTMLDMQIQARFYSATSGWIHKSDALVKLLYHFGNLPALALAVGGLAMVGWGYSRYKYIKWRKIGYFLVLTMVLAPGLLINVILKDHWGRPRPRNVVEFGGKYQYEKLLSIEPSSAGKSFPCGHASMGFYLFVPWFLLRKKQPKYAVLSLFTGLLAGFAIGWARVAQGGHFASDVLWSCLLVYLTAAGVFYALKMDSTIWYYPPVSEIPRKHKLLMQYTIGILITILILGVMLATPYEKERHYSSKHQSGDTLSIIKLTYTLERGEVTIKPAEQIAAADSSLCFGFPGSKVLTKYRESSSKHSLIGTYTQSIKGFFTESEIQTSLAYPTADSLQYKLTMDQGNVNMTIPEDFNYLDVKISINKGNLILDIPANCKPDIELKGDHKFQDQTGFESDDGIYVNPAFKLSLIVREGSIVLK